LPRITAVDSVSSGWSGRRASRSASPAHKSAHFWPSSMAAATRGGILSFVDSNATPRTHPPIFE
jgi:hypothetical protein